MIKQYNIVLFGNIGVVVWSVNPNAIEEDFHTICSTNALREE